ncbi:hypothetical protein HHK36_031645 [Tetracentron sinense]|uniref:Uncharacterized protein n=1 Tax=Tetracentron sinense TaxID=13715 RepID=A0A834YAR7_TETSI|nr:hypothetical protein HHK36_031645 [Tetracentron sinense]
MRCSNFLILTAKKTKKLKCPLSITLKVMKAIVTLSTSNITSEDPVHRTVPDHNTCSRTRLPDRRLKSRSCSRSRSVDRSCRRYHHHSLSLDPHRKHHRRRDDNEKDWQRVAKVSEFVDEIAEE